MKVQSKNLVILVIIAINKFLTILTITIKIDVNI